MLRQKDKELKAKERELEKFRREFKKLQKLKELKLAITFPIGHTGRDKEPLEEKRQRFSKKSIPSPPYIMRCKNRRKGAERR